MALLPWPVKPEVTVQDAGGRQLVITTRSVKLTHVCERTIR
jgi:hypothetical protein